MSRGYGRGGRGGEPLCADEDVPWLDAGDLQSLGPRVVGEAEVDVGFAVCREDEQRAQAPPPGSCERPGEEEEALLGERVHEGGVVAEPWLCVDPSVWLIASSFLGAGDQDVELVLEPVVAVGRAVCGESLHERVLELLLAVAEEEGDPHRRDERAADGLVVRVVV